jgi:hypothetical protein
METSKKSLAFALEKYPQKIELASIESLLLDSARQSGKRPAYLKVAVPDEIVKGLRGRKPPTEALLLLRVPREVLERAESPIVLPEEF